jgi:NAD(P)-dependent dehydrogenase (short-subunit alcohol dehydrogenase family)
MAELRYDGRVAVITGAGRGLGRAHALLLASRGAKVVVNDIGTNRRGDDGVDVGPAQQVVDEIRAAGGEAVANRDSVATPEGGKAIVEAALDNWGRIDILVHNATINRAGPFRDMSFADFSAILDVHLNGAFHTARAAFPRMCDDGFGRIVFTSSIAGLYGERGLTGYATGKAALIGLANVLAFDGAPHNVTCNCIVPAAETRLAEGRDTEGYPPWGPEMVSPAVAWLAHESCKATGELLVSLAGRVAKAYVAETRGVYRPEWTPEDIAAEMEAISDKRQQVVFPPYPSGFNDHLQFSFDMARSGGAS